MALRLAWRAPLPVLERRPVVRDVPGGDPWRSSSSKPASAIRQARSGLGAHPRARPRTSSGASRRSAPSSIRRSCTTTRWKPRWCIASAERLDHPDVSAELIRQAYADALEDQPQIGEAFRADIVATFDRDPADRPLHRAGALLQGLPRHPDPPAGALAVEQGPQGLRLLPAEPLVGGVPVRHHVKY